MHVIAFQELGDFTESLKSNNWLEMKYMAFLLLVRPEYESGVKDCDLFTHTDNQLLTWESVHLFVEATACQHE